MKYDYGYDAIGRLIRTDISSTIDNSAVASTEYGYNTRGHLTSITNEIGGRAYGQYYSYSDTGVSGALANAKDGLPTRYRTLGTDTDYSYDSLNRLRTKSVKVSDSLSLNNTYTYKDSLRGTGYTTTQLATESVVGVNYGYTYDNMGNITSITRGGNAYREYMYDSLGQLTQERNLSTNTMTSYTYNHLGNITVKNIDDANGINEKGVVRYGYSKDSNAGWNYLLTSIITTDYTNNSTTTETIDYDAIGNPISYRGASMSWFGRQLRTYSKGSTTASLVYDADGLRSSKTIGGVKTTYQYVGDQLFYENRGNGNELYYFYDSYGNLTRIYHHNNGNKAAYYVATNAQGDVIALYNASGKKVGAYDYDAWGNQRVFVVTQDSSGANVHTQINPATQYLTHIVNLNPIRYRGYYFDRDLGLYYLQSRYYDSDVGRFINADDRLISDDIIGMNVFAYCCNNPVINSDSSGENSDEARRIETDSSNSIFGLAIVLLVGWLTYRIASINTRALPRYSSPSISKPKAKVKARVDADATIRDTVKQDSKERYWTANFNGTVTIGNPISYDTAVKEVAAGRNVFTVTRAEAEAVARVAGGEATTPLHHPKHFEEINYYEHYHMEGHSNGAHVWYLY